MYGTFGMSLAPTSSRKVYPAGWQIKETDTGYEGALETQHGYIVVKATKEAPKQGKRKGMRRPKLKNIEFQIIRDGVRYFTFCSGPHSKPHVVSLAKEFANSIFAAIP